MRRPARDVPVAILGATAVAACLYVAVALVAAGVPGLPASPGLDVVARRTMGSAGAAAFALGTGIVSMIGIMNTHLIWGSRSILMVCRDGWLPRRFARLNRKGAPAAPLCLLGAIGAVPLLAGLDLADVIRIGGLGAGVSAILSIGCAPLNARADAQAYARSPLAIPLPLLLSVSLLAIGAQLVTLWLLMRTLSVALALMWLGWIAIGFGVALASRGRRSGGRSAAPPSSGEAAGTPW
jgi:APA family basic amino acid/polyamine antiporter